MISLRSCLVLIICSASAFKGITAQNFLSKLNAINYESLIQNMNFDLYEKQIQFGSDLKQNNEADGYDNFKCVQQFSALQKSLNESEVWAIEGTFSPPFAFNLHSPEMMNVAKIYHRAVLSLHFSSCAAHVNFDCRIEIAINATMPPLEYNSLDYSAGKFSSLLSASFISLLCFERVLVLQLWTHLARRQMEFYLEIRFQWGTFINALR